MSINISIFICSFLGSDKAQKEVYQINDKPLSYAPIY